MSSLESERLDDPIRHLPCVATWIVELLCIALGIIEPVLHVVRHVAGRRLMLLTGRACSRHEAHHSDDDCDPFAHVSSSPAQQPPAYDRTLVERCRRSPADETGDFDPRTYSLVDGVRVRASFVSS